VARQRLKPYASFVWRDETGSSVTGRLTCHELAASTLLDAAATIAAASELCSGAVIDSISITYPKADHSPRPALPGAVIDQGAVFIFETADPAQFFPLNIVGVPGTIFDNTQDPPNFYVNTSNPAVAALVGLLSDGIWCNPYGHSLTNLVAAYRIVQ
jgi:hypothetical protein